MKITAQELIDELKKLPPDSEVRFTGRRMASQFHDPEKFEFKFDRICFSNPPTIELIE